MPAFVPLVQILAASLGAFFLIRSLLLRAERVYVAKNAQVTREEPGPERVEMLERVLSLEGEVKALRRKLDDLDDSVDHRFRRLNARAKREAPSDEEPAEEPAQLPMPFGGGNRAAFTPGTTENGRRPFGSRGPFGPNRG